MKQRILMAGLLLCLAGQSACVLVQTRKSRTVEKKTAVGQPVQSTESFSSYQLRFEKEAGADLIFRLTESTVQKTVSRQTYKLEGHETVTMARDKQGRFTHAFMGPAWVTLESGGGAYARNLALSTCMTLGVGLLVAAVDWITLPFQLIDGDYEAEKTERKVLARKQTETPLQLPVAMEFSKRVITPEDGRVSIPRALFFARPRKYPYGRVHFRIQKGDGTRSSWQYRQMKDLFSREQFDRLTKASSVSLPETP